MRILAVGGGSGGHVTPVVAVLHELRAHDPEVELRFWCDRQFAPQAKGIMARFDKDLPVSTVVAGKLRRYHAIPLYVQLLRPWLVLQNIGNLFLVVVGLLQSIGRLVVWRPDVVFTKGGFVCLPVGIAARLLRIPLVIHDSDAHPGLTNRILARWATKIGTGAPLKYYHYPTDKAVYVGIPVEPGLRPLDDDERRLAKHTIGVHDDRPLVVVTGGGLGAVRINNAVAAVLTEVLTLGSLVLISGKSQYDELRQRLPGDSADFQLHAFVSEGMTTMLGAADIVVTRAGATTMFELAALGRPTIIIPNIYLTGGHQLKNAAVYRDADAAVVLDEQLLEDDPALLLTSLQRLLADPQERRRLGEALHGFAKPQAAADMAALIIGAVRHG